MHSRMCGVGYTCAYVARVYYWGTYEFNVVVVIPFKCFDTYTLGRDLSKVN